MSFFSYKTRTGTYRVYKIDFKPKEYEDFINGFIGIIGDTTNLDGVASALFVDHIEYDKTYYYLFVPISIQQQGGNPSYVQEVKLLKDADENILKYNAYELYSQTEPLPSSSTFRKFIQLVPNYNHTIPKGEIDIEAIDNKDETTDLLGPEENNLWELNGKKFIKLRIESKSTGEKFDLNLTFKLKK